MPRKKKHIEEFMTSAPEISVGLIKAFEFYDESYGKRFNGHPVAGRVYRLIKDFIPDEKKTLYRLHIGRETNESQLDGLILGFDLEGSAKNQYSFKIEEVTKDNFLDFDLSEEDIKQVSQWFDTNHKDLREILGLPAIALENGEQLPQTKEAINLVSFLENNSENLDSLNAFPANFDKIFYKDTEFAKILADFTGYVASTYGDKYEAADRGNFTKEYLFTSKSPDVALFNAFKYLQRYGTQGFEKSGNVKDLYKALHYIMFELIRKSRENA